MIEKVAAMGNLFACTAIVSNSEGVINCSPSANWGLIERNEMCRGASPLGTLCPCSATANTNPIVTTGLHPWLQLYQPFGFSQDTDTGEVTSIQGVFCNANASYASCLFLFMTFDN